MKRDTEPFGNNGELLYVGAGIRENNYKRRGTR